MFYVNNIAENTIFETKLSKLCLDSVLKVNIDIFFFVYSAHTLHIFWAIEIINMNSSA